MPSTFYGLDIANKGLFVAQRQINLTGHNIANANTLGYTRQRIVQVAVPPPGGGKWAHVSTAQVGGGVRALTVDQIRDVFLDRQYRNENTRASYWDAKYSALYYVEDIFNNYDTVGGMGELISKFFGALQDLHDAKTVDSAARTTVAETAQSMIEAFRRYYEQLTDLMDKQDVMLVEQTRRINDIGQQIAELNENILRYELGGQNANDLRDKRNLLLDELSGLTDITYQEVDNGYKNINGQSLATLEVKIGGQDFVSHNTYRALAVKQDWVNQLLLDAYGGDASAVPDAEKLHTVVFADDDTPVNFSGGAMKAYLDIRDGNSVNNKGIPYFKAELDQMVKTLVTSFNDIHVTGWTMPYTDKADNSYDSQTGIFFFDPDGLTIDTIALSADILKNVNNIAASSGAVDIASGINTGNNEKLMELIKLQNSKEIGLGSLFNKFIAGLGSEVDHAKKAAESEYLMLSSLDDQRTSVSGVSLDEEMTNLIRFQQAYNAAARVITAMDEALDVLINRTGRVGL